MGNRIYVTPFRVGWLVLSACLVGLLGYGVTREQTTLLFTLYGLLCWGYLRITDSLRFGYANDYLTHSSTSKTLPEPDRFLFLAAILFRLLLLASFPYLSDDYARFLWDGHLVAHGYNPYLYLPSQLIQTPIATAAGLTTALAEQLNSPDYFTVYPPLNQALFALATWFSPHSIPGAVIGLRVPILLADVGSLGLMTGLLKRFNQNPNLALLYGLNPLVILELTGNVHFEGVMIFFVLLAAWFFVQNRPGYSSVAFALGIGTKLLPLIFLPLLVSYLGWKRGIRYCALTVAVTVILFLPFLNFSLVQNIVSSLNLYFQQFEFNASVYYLIRAVGYWLLDMNIIHIAGIVLFLGISIGVIRIAFGKPRYPVWPVVPNKVLFTLTIYWLLATTVHPWYITALVAASVFTRFRFPLIWSGVVILSYSAYQAKPYHENLWLTGLEYGLVLAAGVYDWYGPRSKQAA